MSRDEQPSSEAELPETAQFQGKPQYAAVPAQVDLPAMERDILSLWDERDTFARSIEATLDGEPWVFYEGPPTANGTPGTHHVEARVFKDVFPRFKTMQGFRVDRKAGWDCHGLPVELAVEAQLGFDGKADIERYGVAAFNAKCREDVLKNVDAFADMTRRMGYWVNLDEAYVTMTPEYVQSVWWALKTVFDKGLLVEDYRVAPYCPRCGTTLSDHELAQGYEDVIDPSVFVRFPLTSGPFAGRAHLLVWTTTPWTLVANSAVAVHPGVTYVVAESGDDVLVVAEPLFEKVLGEGWQITARFDGATMERWTYQRPFEFIEYPEPAHFVVLADYVTTEDGTGLVHQAPAFGADDMVVCRRYGLPIVNPVRADGSFAPDVPVIGGLFFKTADAPLVADLTERGLMFRKLDYEHSYPHCWRCHTPLMYYAQPAWYIRTTQIKDALIAQNELVSWFPDTIKHGRFGDWLENNVDWALSRKRYWGTPLPIWRNDEDPSKLVCVGSLAELSQYVGEDLSALDPHRPFVDDVTFQIEGQAGTYRRVSEVIDAWFDSGSMPFAQWGFPWVEGSAEQLARNYPADFIAEAIDQTRGWFYTLLAVGTLVFDKTPFKNVLCLGHIMAEDGRKMSKHLGNILLPVPLMDEHGADAVRWFMAASGSPWGARRVGHATLQELVRKVMLTYWNTVSFHALYARANDWSPAGPAPAVAGRDVIDRWLLSSTQKLVGDVTVALEAYDTTRVGVLLSTYIDDLSNWYVRRSRRRFWDGSPSALFTLHECLNVLTRLMAPLTPFIAERVWQDLFVATGAAEESVHLAAWPTADESLLDPELEHAMKVTRRLVELGRAARAESKMKVRQPLARILVPSSSLALLTEELRAELLDELNVRAVDSFADAGDVVEYSAKGNFRALGKRFGKETPTVAAAIVAAPAKELVDALNATGSARVGSYDVTAEEVLVSERPRDGWSVANEHGETVALDLHLTPDLVRAGLVREVIRFVQETRKNSGLDVSDRITLSWHGSGDVADAIRAGQSEIADEVLALDVVESAPNGDWARDEDLALAVHVAKR